MSAELLLIDLPYIAHSTFHAAGMEAAPESVAKQIAVRVRQLAANHAHAAICCDSPKSFRRDLDPTYKAQRETEHREVIARIIALACAELATDGFPIWQAEGFEADDVIATATAQALAMDGRVLILSSDKDLLQLVSDRVTVKGLRDKEGKLTNDGMVMDAAAVLSKLKVRPDQVLDYLCLVGDNSDNVKGAEGIGPAKASALLAKHGTLAAVYEALSKGQPAGMTPSLRSSLVEFRDRVKDADGAIGAVYRGEDIPSEWKRIGLEHVRKLLTLRTDAPIPFHEIGTERQGKQMGAEHKTQEQLAEEAEVAMFGGSATVRQRELTDAQAVDAATAAARQAAERIRNGPTPEESRRIVNAPIVPYREPSALPARRASVAPEPVIDDEQMALIKRTVAAGATNDELNLFIYDCKRRGVHPLDRLLHFTKRNGKYTPITSIDFLRTRAHDTGACAGISDPSFIGEAKKAGFAASVTVKRLVDGVIAEFGATARWEEYKPQTNDFMWAKMPFTMLGKCAEALALRKAFPQELGGLYTGDEMAQAGVFAQED